MFVGHGAIAFAIVGLGAYGFGWPRERSLSLGALAFLLATVPDVDMVYALTGLVGLGSAGPLAMADGFWTASTVVHRSVTHSVVLAVPVAMGTALLAGSRRRQVVGVAGLGTLVVLVGLDARPLSIAIMSAFVLGAAGIGLLARKWGFGTVPVLAAAFVGLVSHPFGDLLTGTPPNVLYPLDVELIGSRIALASDPTLHLLGTFLVELAAIWFAIYAVLTLHDERVADHLKPRAVLGGVYGLAVLFMPPPTLDVSYHFVFSVVSVGFVGAIPSWRTGFGWTTRVVTGVAAVTVGVLAYTAGYLVAL